MTLETIAAFVSSGALVASVGGIYYLIRYFTDGDVYDTAGNRVDVDVAAPATPEDSSVEIVVNKHCNSGFLAVSLRLHDKWADKPEVVDQLFTDLDHAADRMLRDVDICVECEQTSGRHLARCRTMAEYLAMDGDEMMSEVKIIGDVVDERVKTKERQ